MSTNKHVNKTHHHDEEGGGTSNLPNSISSNNEPTPTRRRSMIEAASRRISTVADSFLKDKNVQDPNALTDEEMKPMVNAVLQSYTDKDGNVNAEEIVRDSLRSNIEKIKQQVLNSELMKTVSII